MKLSVTDKIFHFWIYTFLVLLGISTLYPFWNAFVISLNVGSDTALGGITIWPRQFTLNNYALVFRDSRLINGFGVSIARLLVGTFLSILFTSMFAYAMARKGLLFKKTYMIICIITLYFSGGLIPTFILVRALGMMDTFWVMVIPGIISVWNMIIFRTFFMGLPDGLEESAKLDGCGDYGIYFRIVVPISGPVIATLSLFTAVYHWNDWFTATIYINSQHLLPVQTILNQIISSNIVSEQLAQAGGAASSFARRVEGVTTKSLVMATMIVVTLPILLVYPFLQRFFAKGVLVGSLKE